MTDETNSNGVDVDDDVENDAVIGSAFRASLVVIMLLGLPVIGYLIYLNLSKEKATKTVVEEVLDPTVRDVSENEVPALFLADVSDSCGVQFKHETGREGEKLLPETMGSGVAVFDYNNDGHQDILFVNSSHWPWAKEPDAKSPSRLFAGDGKFQFTDVTDQAGLDNTFYAMGVAVGDYDNDGDSDLFFSAVGKDRLLRNDNGKFTDVTEASGVSGSDEAWGTSCGFFDYDNDGRLDLFVCNYVAWSKETDLSYESTLDGENRAYGPPKAFSGSFSYLYHNDGDGKFSDVSQKAGIQVRNDDTDEPLGKAMGVAPVDINKDGWMDIVVANDTVRNFLFENNKDGTFSETGRLHGIAYDISGNARGAMGIDTTIFRPSGALAIGIGNFANEQSALFIESKRSGFIPAEVATGLGPPTRLGLTFGFFFFDVDLDGRPDIFGANGHLEEDIAKTQRTQKYAQSPQLFWNAGRGSGSELIAVEEACTGSGFCEPIVGRGAAFGDFDSDGDQDIVVSVSNGSPRIFRNDQKLEHHWLRVHLIGSQANRDAIGAQVSIQVGDETRIQQVMPTRSYLSQSERVLTFGLGENDNIQSVQVTWPGGQQQTQRIDGIDRQIEITQSNK